MLALCCAGFNNVDLEAARELGITVTRVPAYSPHAVAEHTLALLRSLNRQIHRAYHRVRDHNFSLALDVYEEEEGVFFEDLSGEILHDDDLTRLLTFPNVLITSHQAFLTEEALTEIAQTSCENLRRFSQGEEPIKGTQV